MKKVVSLALAFVMLFSMLAFVGCTKKQENNTDIMHGVITREDIKCYQEGDSIYVPIDITKKNKNYTVNVNYNGNTYKLFVDYYIGAEYKPGKRTELTIESQKDEKTGKPYVLVPIEYCNENYSIVTRPNNVRCSIKFRIE